MQETLAALNAALNATSGVLLVLEVLYVAKYTIMMRQRNMLGSWEKFGLTRAKLHFRLSYFVNRYAEHAPWWQFVIWFRQLLLTFTTLMPEFVASRLALNSGNTGQTSLEVFQQRQALDLTLLWIHAAIAVVIFIVFWYIHVRWAPYGHRFQNILESWLFFSDICIVGLGCVYTVLYTYYDQISLPSLFVEISILFACVGQPHAATAHLHAAPHASTPRRHAASLLRRRPAHHFTPSTLHLHLAPRPPPSHPLLRPADGRLSHLRDRLLHLRIPRRARARVRRAIASGEARRVHAELRLQFCDEHRPPARCARARKRGGAQNKK